MPRKQTRRSTTLSKIVYEAARAHSATTGEPVARMIERAVRRELGLPRTGPQPAWSELSDDRGIVPGSPNYVDIGPETAERLKAAVRRASIAAGRFLDEGRVLGEALERALDSLGAPPAPSRTH